MPLQRKLQLEPNATLSELLGQTWGTRIARARNDATCEFIDARLLPSFVLGCCKFHLPSSLFPVLIIGQNSGGNGGGRLFSPFDFDTMIMGPVRREEEEGATPD